MRSKRVTASLCLACGKTLDAASGANKRPKPGDITLCMYCGHIMAFDGKLHFRPLTDAEMHKVAGDKRILNVQWARGKAMEK